MPEGTLWSTDLGAPLHIDTDADPNLWGYLHLQINKKTLKEWLKFHLNGLAAIHDIKLAHKLHRGPRPLSPLKTRTLTACSLSARAVGQVRTGSWFG